MRIATFNVNSIRSRLDIVLDWLKEHQPDALCLQETKCRDEDFPAAAIRDAGFEVAYRGEKSYNGVALIARAPMEDVVFGLPAEPSDPTRLVAARIKGVAVLNAYVPQGRAIDHDMYPYKLAWLTRLKELLQTRFSPREPLALCGDLNVARHPVDVTNPQSKKQHVCYHEDVRRTFENLLEWGLTDVFRQAHPGEALYSFFDYRVPNAVERNIGWRIDYILATIPLAATCHRAEIDLQPRLREKPSDHTVLAADFDC